MEEALVLIIIFGTIFGVFYMYFSTRNKERLALIEKGADASIFVKGKKGYTTIFTMAGLGLFTGFKITNKILEKEQAA